MGIKSKMMKAAPKLASRPTRSQRKKDALASKAVDAAQAAAEGKRLTRSQRKAYGAAMPKRWRREGLAAMLTSVPQGLAAPLRRKPTAGIRGRLSRRDAIPAGIPRKRSR